MEFTTEKATKVARRLGIKITAAKEGTENHRLWLDKVLHAAIIENELSEYRWDQKENSGLKPFLIEAIEDANRHAA